MRLLLPLLALPLAVLLAPPPAPRAQVGATASPFLMVDEARQRGVEFRQTNFATEMKYPFETLGGAVAAFDFDDDGWVDLLFLNGAPSPEHVRRDPASFNRLFRNTGHGRFVDVTAESGLSGAGIKGYPQGVAVGDYDNDGYPDVLVTNYGDNVLYHNDGNGHFTDVTARAGVAMPAHPLKASAAFLDYDNDGWLDIFVTHYFDWTLAKQGDVWCGRREPGARIYCDPDAFEPLPNALLRNNHDGTFSDVSAQVGLDRSLGKGMGVAVADYDGDGRTDVFVTNDRVPHFLYRNTKEGRFEQVAFEAGVAANESGVPVSGMGCDFEDFDDDGWPDVFLTDLEPRRVHPLHQPADGVLRRPHLPLGRRLGLDGAQRLEHEDAGHRRRRPQGRLRGRLARGRQRQAVQPGGQVRGGLLPLSRPRRRAGGGPLRAGGPGPPHPRRLAGGGGRPTSTTTARRRWPYPAQRRRCSPREEGRAGPQLDPAGPRGQRSNRDAIGARVRLVLPSGRTLHQHVTTANGIYSASDKRLHFGLGTETAIATSRSPGPAASCSACRTRPSTRSCTSWSRRIEGRRRTRSRLGTAVALLLAAGLPVRSTGGSGEGSEPPGRRRPPPPSERARPGRGLPSSSSSVAFAEAQPAGAGPRSGCSRT